MRTVLKLCLLAVFLVMAHWQLPTLMVGQAISGGWPTLIAVWLSTTAATVLLALLPSTRMRIFWTVIWGYAAINALAYYYITGLALNTVEVERLWQDIAFIDETFAFYGELIVKAVLVALPLLAALLIPPDRLQVRGRRAGWWVSALAVLPIFLVARTVYQDGGGDSDAFPLTSAPLGFAGVLLYDELTMPVPAPRQTVSLQAATSPFDKIVVLMDESVRGDYLDLVDANGIQTHLLTHPATVNFGLAASHANCSAASNLTFRFAARREHFLADEKQRPSLWAYAHAAGYRTIYLDGQRTGKELQNFMSAAELREIDELIQHDEAVTAIDKDRLLVDKLAALMARSERLYIFVNKAGVHFPYEGKYPQSQAPYQPHMSGTLINAGESNQYGDGFGDEKFQNSYRNAVAWNTGEFFKKLLPQIDFTKTLLVYTSDHGQNFSKTKEQGFLTHCTTGPAPASEGSVPLAFLTSQTEWQTRLHAAAQKHLHRASQWNVPVTVLAAMGFPESELAQQYEPTVFAENLGPQSFVSTYFVRFGLQPYWNSALDWHAGTVAKAQTSVTGSETAKLAGAVLAPH